MSGAVISSGEWPDRVDEKSAEPDAITPSDEAELEHGHLKELEVDVSKVVGEEGLEDYDGDESPYPEGKLAHSRLIYQCRSMDEGY